MEEAIRKIRIELFDSQNEIIKQQADIITDLIHLLEMHIDSEELDRLPVIEKINHVAAIRKEHRL